MPTLYAWAKPAFFNGSLMDHTWVTDYDNRTQKYLDINEVVANGKNYWYAWGDYHILGSTPLLTDGFVCGGDGSLPLAKCLCLPNVPSKQNHLARGTIFNYGIEGVCHQLTNQILAATDSKLLVTKVRGYILTTMFFGDYGKSEDKFWNSKYTGCSSQPDSYRSDLMSFKEVQMNRHVDTFETRARSILSGKSNHHKLNKLLELRRAQQSYLHSLSDKIDSEKISYPSAEELNAKYNEFLSQAADLLGPAAFQSIFDFPPDTVVKLVDESQLKSAA
ncbi:hypothetical protein [Undibacterium umbellatum]|uniref:Uncharacterized protein n=1 Tax=Undibacterium umbellatum TaxID=2762300 RepID=A0ABR6Z4G5_9BURK|nr:hypothetical protein [Undibacterium umbellatum]MBC3906235.1 hypothetical protein [Undibacterium umbellatum]